jgi:hypothetical protein
MFTAVLKLTINSMESPFRWVRTGCLYTTSSDARTEGRVQFDPSREYAQDREGGRCTQDNGIVKTEASEVWKEGKNSGNRPKSAVMPGMSEVIYHQGFKFVKNVAK